MMKLFTAFFFLLIPFSTQAQEITLSSNQQSLTIVGGKTTPETILSIGKQFINCPYVPHTLDTNPTEQLVVNLREFDCTTYLETVLALSLAWQDMGAKPNQAVFEQSFRTYLTKLRYRDGRIDGYASRLHYFSDWLRDNERKGLVTDVTRDLPGSMAVAKPVSYMTTATYKYPRLTDPAILKQVAQTEAAISQQTFSFIPKKAVKQAEASIREGDIVMLMAARPGLDMKHVGIAVRQPNGQLHLMHASSEQGAVVITPYPLSDYVLWHRGLSGIRIARLRSESGTPPIMARGKQAE